MSTLVSPVFIERFWRSIKYEEVYLRAYESVSEAKASNRAIHHVLQRATAALITRRPHPRRSILLQQPIKRRHNLQSYHLTSPIRCSKKRGHLFSPERQVLSDIASGNLADVTWVIPDLQNSDHSSSRSDTGPSWVTSVVNAVGNSKFWSSTAIFITWDDSGGWYDHVPPPRLDYDGLGFRVPLIVVSPYAKRDHVSHTQYEFGGILRFAETAFSLDPLAASDRRANSMRDCFDFRQRPRPFTAISTAYSKPFFDDQHASNAPPDDD